MPWTCLLKILKDVCNMTERRKRGERKRERDREREREREREKGSMN